ncbi:MAG: hypothetical protein LBU27_00800 [Candidatus Peribacteria bacterium]|jgi:hypothetical protein|nr:hypothetical protein [Candidatus Peribacteria bacterium]
MKKYILRSKAFLGEVLVEIDDKQDVVFLDIRNAEMNENQRAWTCQKFSVNETVKNLLTSPNTEIIESKEEITFSAFWNKYDDKLSSSKKKTEAKWNKMSEGEQAKAYNHIPRYFCTLVGGIRKKYAETYLNSELWNN